MGVLPTHIHQIRNLTRLAKILYPNGQETLEQMRGVLHCGSMRIPDNRISRSVERGAGSTHRP